MDESYNCRGCRQLGNFARLGAEFVHTSRSNLIERAMELHHGSTGFFIPHQRRAFNSTTVATLESKADLSIFMVAYGTLEKYMCYDLEELNGGLAPFGEENNLFAFRIYDAAEALQEISREEAMSLLKLLANFRDKMTSSERVTAVRVTRSIKKIDASLQGGTEWERNVSYSVSRLETKVQETIKRYLKQLFLVGMYLRRWAGPPHPYSLREEDTKSETDPTTTVLGHLGDLGDILVELETQSSKAVKLVQNLRQVEHIKGKPHQSDSATLAELIAKMVSGNFCIRVASTTFVGTGVHYSKLFFKEEFLGYNSSLVATIF